MRLALYAVVFAGCSIHHRSGDLGDAGDDGSTDTTRDDGRVPDAPPDAPTDGGGIGGIPGLALWLNGGVGVTHDATTGLVSAWADQSPNHNDAAPANDQNAPTYVAQSIHQQPGIHFGVVGTPELTIASSPSLNWGVGDFVIEVVVEFKNPPPIGVQNPDATPCFYLKGPSPASGNGLSGVGLFGNSEGGAGASGRIGAQNGIPRTVRVLSALNNGTPHVIALHRNGDTLELRVDGASVATTTGAKGIDISSDQAAEIGSLLGGQAFRVDGDIDEIIAVAGTNLHLNEVETYLTTKYGL
jgi:hypothetical protein